MSGINTPDVRNLVVGKGVCLFKPEEGFPGAPAGVYFALGNVPKLVYSPKVTVLPHMSAMAGTKVQDFSVITAKGGELAVDMEEATAKNLALFFLGSIDSTNPDSVKVGIMDQLAQIRGAFRFIATNDVGPRWYLDLNRVLIAPTGQFNPISDAYNVMTVTMTHVIDDDGLWGTITKKPDVSTVAPENIVLPYITGPLHEGDVPAFAKVGEVMTANVGAWVGSQAFTYKWYANAVLINGATSKKYTPVSGDIGKVLTVQVEASNSVGTTDALSDATMAVHS